MRVLALVPGDIGNQILFFPTLETIKQQYPQASIDVLVEPSSKKAYRVCKNVDDVLVFDFQDRNSFADYLNLLGTVRDREYDVLISLKTSWRIKLLLWLNGIPTRIGYQDDSAIYLSTTVNRKAEQYTAQMYHDLLTGLGIRASCPPITINVPTEDIQWAESEQQRRRMDSGYIVLWDQPSTTEISSYPIANWQTIVQDMEQRQTGLSIVILQSDRNQAWVTTMVSANGNLKEIAPPDVGKTAAIIAGANLVLCTSGMAMQLAIATDTYTFALVGSQDKTIPINQENCHAISSKTEDLQEIQPETVITQLWQQ
ncbi:glycosyltransferase [Pleurocapsa sp. CCALA 161]|uniref:glycosyltransferase family 9 protein n=1 Tax=Pleurocapsa sp. CCALA 161 TaxID=2107688 RepID=UPI000D06D3AE|nr:glycosyltransferase family 9 protein [Pleurocapsa sp. CCALA 161]PSB10037.1 glycosyltransferase [Pleurocapsa sp. CCALA 161]